MSTQNQHSELADIIEAGFDRFTPYDLCVPEAKAALESLVEQYEDVRDKWVTLDVEYERLKEQFETLRNGLEIIATTTYPATFIGHNAKGVAMYGGSQDASRFAREILDRVSNPASRPS